MRVSPVEDAVEPATHAETIRLDVEGMSCAACQVYVERVLRETPGVQSAVVNLVTHSAQVHLGESGSASAVIDAIRNAGYNARQPKPGSPAQTADDHSDPNHPAREQERMLGLRASFLLVCGAVLMLASLPLMLSPAMSGAAAKGVRAGIGHALEGRLSWLFAVPQQPLALGMLALTLAGMTWAGASIYRRAWAAARHRTTNMHTLVALGTLSAFAYSATATLAPGFFLAHHLQPEVYYDSVLLILGFLLLGSWLDARAKRRTLAAMRGFVALQPEFATVMRNGMEVRVSTAAIVAGETILVRPGERLPADGLVLEGTSTLDESLLTGESVPVVRTAGEPVIGGSLNYDGLLQYRATSVGAGSMLGRIIELIETAQASKAPMQQHADRVSRVFVPIVLAIAAVTFLVWTVAVADPGRALGVAVAVLVIACPCAMGLAVPAALTVAIGRAAQLGVLFKGGEELERLAGIDTVIFDKTGTLTEGKPRITRLLPARHSGANTGELLRVAAALEHGSEHPLAAAVLARAERGAPRASQVQARPGRGITGIVDGLSAAAGNAALLAEYGVTLDEDVTAVAGSGSLLHVALDGRYLGTLVAEDTLRPTARAAVAALARMGLRTRMLTGDSQAAAGAVAAACGIVDFEAAMLPQDKVTRIATLQAAGRRVAMVGDGLNDAAALAQADAGLAIGTGTDLAREAGDAVLLRGDPSEVVKAIALARHTRRAMRQNLGWALGYNLLGIPLAAGALYPLTGLLLSPAMASLAMALSSVSVLANSLRLRSYTPPALRSL